MPQMFHSHRFWPIFLKPIVTNKPTVRLHGAFIALKVSGTV